MCFIEKSMSKRLVIMPDAVTYRLVIDKYGT